MAQAGTVEVKVELDGADKAVESLNALSKGAEQSASKFERAEKAFDKIHPQAITTSLTRFGVQPALTRIIEHFYSNPQFKVLSTGKPSQVHTAHSGIKQGCPLSPYLFLVVHSAIMHDVTQLMTDNDTRALPTIHSQFTPLFDLAYADDTVLIGKSSDTVQRALTTTSKPQLHSTI